MIFIYKFILVLLMIIELVILIVSIILYLNFSQIIIEFFVIYYLIFSVCEGVLGLSLLVLIIRFHGNELYYLFNIMKFN